MDLGTSRTWNVTVPVIVNHPGEYFIIGTVQLYTGINDSVAYRWDFSSALDSFDGRYIQYQAPYVVNEVSQGVLYASYIAIAIASLVILFLIFQTYRHRAKPVLQLSQADFLLVFLFSALFGTIFSFLLAPKSDAYCRISYPLILIPIQLMYAITVGRLWRIHAVISPLLLEHLNKGKTTLTQLFIEALTYVSFQLSKPFVKEKKGSIRRATVAGSVKQQITQFQLALVVALFTLPQLVIQLVAVIFQPQKRVIVFNADESVGRATCDSGMGAARDLITYSFALLVLLVIILLLMAHSGRKLPSLFNETHVIYDSTFLSMVVICLGAAVIALTSGPDFSPDVEYFMSLVLILSITLNSAVRIVMPKLRMVWRGEVVIVSKLVTDHHRKAREKQMEKNALMHEKNALMHGVTGFDPSNNIGDQSSFNGNGDPQSSLNGDYAPSQDKKLLTTIHSNSYDTGMIARRSSIDGSEVQRQSLMSLTEEEPPFYSTSGADRETDDFIDNMLEPDVGLPALGEHYIYAVNEEDSDAITSLIDGTQPHTPHRVDGSDAESKDHATTAAADDGVDLEAAVGAAIPSESDEGATEKRRSKGFLKHAMAKGLSSFRLLSHSTLPSESNAKPNDAPGNDTSGGQPPKSVVSKSPKRPAQEPQKRLSDRIFVTEDETPARRLVLRMLDLQDQLEEINNKIMSGFAVTHEEWSLVTKLTSKLDKTFKTEVEFEWDTEQRYKKSLGDVMPADMEQCNTTTTAPPLKKSTRRLGILQKAHNTDETSDDSNIKGDASRMKPVQEDESAVSFAYEASSHLA
jgi:7 transmembrane sweet-taste receptor of 3 GCPR